MTNISPFGSVASASKSESSSDSSEVSLTKSSAPKAASSQSSNSEGGSPQKSVSSQSEPSVNSIQHSPSEEDSADNFYAHISHREVIGASSVSKDKSKGPQQKIPPSSMPQKLTNEDAKLSPRKSLNASDVDDVIEIGTEIETSVPITSPPKEKKKNTPKKKKAASRKPKEETAYATDLSQKVSSGTKRISWNSDPIASYSDWKVEVLVRETQHQQTFHLHRNIVGFGPRKSDVLKTAFEEHQEGEENMTKLILPEDQARVFPMVLDYIYYTSEARQPLTASRACAMYNIAERLEIISLEKAIMEFYRKNTSLENVAEFFKCAKDADALSLIAVSKAKIGTMIIQKPELGELVPPSFLIEIIDIYREEFEDLRKKNPGRRLDNSDLLQSKRLSKAAYLCVSKSKSSMTEQLLDQLTNEKALPVIDVAVALPFLNLSAKFEHGSSKYTSLQRRCVKSITENWPKFQKQFSSSEKVSNALKKLPSHILADILVLSMNP